MKVNIEKLDYEGKGITHVDGKIVFVPRTLPGEEVEISIRQNQKHYCLGKVEKILKKSEKRISSFCPYAHQCGGCAFDMVSYQESIQYKKVILEELCQRNFSESIDIDMVESRPVLGYRNKGKFHVQNFQYGFYEEESHRFVPIHECYLMHPRINQILAHFDWFKFERGTLMIRVNEKEEILLSIETEDQLKISQDLVLKFPIVGILINHQSVYQTSYLKIQQNHFQYLVKDDSFFQVNFFIGQKIAEKIHSLVCKNDCVLDLYCGCGYFTFFLAPALKKIVGVELNPSSVLPAVKMIEVNHLKNVQFHAGKVEQILPQFKESFHKVIVDPPRSGLHKNVIQCFLEQNYSEIYYISCNPKTLIRDIQLLKENYQVVSLTGYDMFCYTKHIECLCILKRKL